MNSNTVNLEVSVRLDAYKIISDTIETSIKLGWNRAHKHIDNPEQQHVLNEIHTAIMNDLCQILKFDDEE